MKNSTVIDSDKIIKNHKPSSLTKFLIITGAFFGIHPWAIIISIPLFSIGLIRLWRNIDLNKKLKLKWTLYPLLIIVSIWILIITIVVIYDHLL